MGFFINTTQKQEITVMCIEQAIYSTMMFFEVELPADHKSTERVKRNVDDDDVLEKEAAVTVKQLIGPSSAHGHFNIITTQDLTAAEKNEFEGVC